MLSSKGCKKGIVKIKGTEYDVNCEKTNIRLIFKEVHTKHPL